MGSLKLSVNLLGVHTIQPQSNKFVADAKKVTGEQKVNDSPGLYM